MGLMLIKSIPRNLCIFHMSEFPYIGFVLAVITPFEFIMDMCYPMICCLLTILKAVVVR